MDYFSEIELIKWDNFSAFECENPIDSRHFFLSTKANQSYFEAQFCDECFLHFGREDKGLPLDLINAYFAQTYKIPMQNGARSLNLANAVSAVAYEAIQQMGQF